MSTESNECRELDSEEFERYFKCFKLKEFRMVARTAFYHVKIGETEYFVKGRFSLGPLDNRYSKESLRIHQRLSERRKECESVVHLEMYYIEDGGRKYYFFYKLYGGNLAETLTEKRGGFECDVKIVFKSMILALKQMHDLGFAHLDIKPSNFVEDGKGGVMIIDMDGSTDEKEFSANFFTRATEKFTAPELENEELCDPKKSDIFALGKTLLFMVTFLDIKNLENFQKVSPSELFPMCYMSEELNNLLRMMLRTEWRDRISLDEVLNHKWLNNEVVSSFSDVEREKIVNVKEPFGWSVGNYKLFCDNNEIKRLMIQKMDYYSIEEIIIKLNEQWSIKCVENENKLRKERSKLKIEGEKLDEERNKSLFFKRGEKKLKNMVYAMGVALFFSISLIIELLVLS